MAGNSGCIHRVHLPDSDIPCQVCGGLINGVVNIESIRKMFSSLIRITEPFANDPQET